MPRSAAPAALGLTALLLAACGAAPRAFGPATTATARTHTEDFFGGLAVRFVDVQRAPKFAAARPKLARYALTPSRLWTDTAVWTGATATTRWLELEGRADGRRYQFLPRPAAPAPERSGEARHVMRLAQVGDGEWQWNTVVEHAVGRVRAGDVATATRAGIATFAQPERALRATFRDELPRTSAALGRLLTLDSVASTRLADGSYAVELGAGVRPERIRPTMPAFADYVAKWVHPGRLRLTLADARGARWLEMRMGDDRLSFRFRTRDDGTLLALDGAARPMPDTLLLRVDVRERFMLWDVGVSEMVGDLTTVRASHERGWTVRWRRAPRWHIPLGMRHLMSATLDRPFERDGMLLRLTLRDADAGQTLLVRRFDVAIKESAIVRWLGSLGSRAMDDFAGRAEAEENRFLADALYALRGDALAALGAESAPGAATR